MNASVEGCVNETRLGVAGSAARARRVLRMRLALFNLSCLVTTTITAARFLLHRRLATQLTL